jgi:small subunit ribosomal protein S9
MSLLRQCLRRAYTSAAAGPGAARSSPLDTVRTTLLNNKNASASAPTGTSSGDRGSPRQTPPSSPSFYTTRAVFYDQVAQLERAISTANHALRRAQLLPLPAFARESLPSMQTVWKSKEEMTADFQTKMTLSRYRKVTKLLNELNEYYRIAETAGVADISQKIYSIVSLFESAKKDAYLARGKRKPVVLDAYGRSYTVGKRKTSSARVWMIPVQQPAPPAEDSKAKAAPIPMTTILVNNIPLNEFFPLPADRERITRPLKVAGLIGKYNVFAITRGGGTTGQSGALAHGISKGIVAHEPDLEVLFRKGAFAFLMLEARLMSFILPLSQTHSP